MYPIPELDGVYYFEVKIEIGHSIRYVNLKLPLKAIQSLPLPQNLGSWFLRRADAIEPNGGLGRKIVGLPR
jgi:hypothetical protein